MTTRENEEMPSTEASEAVHGSFVHDRFGRREFLRRGAVLGAAVGLSGPALVSLVSCGPSGSESSGKGGNLIIARTAESEGMDKTMVFDNESIWIFLQMYETLYTVAPDGKKVLPYLAESYELSKDKKEYTFHLRKGVTFHNGKEMTSEDVKFSIDEARNTKGGWEFIDAAIDSVEAPDPTTVIIKTKYKWAPLLADIACFNNGIIPKDYAGKSKEEFYKAPIGTGPFKWDHWDKGKELKLVRYPDYWQKGKSSLNSATWTLVSDDSTRSVQVQGGQADVDEFPPFSSIQKLKNTPGVVMKLFPSTRTDYMVLNHRVKPLDDVHVSRAISYAVDRKALIESVLFGYGEPANSFMPPQVRYYDPDAPGLQFDPDKARQEMSRSSVPDGFNIEMTVEAGNDTQTSTAQIIQQQLKKIGIDVKLQQLDPSVAQTNVQEFKYEIGFSYWTMDIADPDELVTFAVDPTSGSHSFFTDYKNEDVIKWTHEAQEEFDDSKRAELYSKIQSQAAEDAFMVFLYYSDFTYLYSNTVKGFKVYPTGNYHLEEVTLET